MRRPRLFVQRRDHELAAVPGNRHVGRVVESEPHPVRQGDGKPRDAFPRDLSARGREARAFPRQPRRRPQHPRQSRETFCSRARGPPGALRPTVGYCGAILSSKGNWPDALVGAPASSRSSRASAMSWSLSFASRCRHRRRIRLTPAGVCSGSFDQSGSSLRTAASVSLTVSPSKARFPVSIS